MAAFDPSAFDAASLDAGGTLPLPAGARAAEVRSTLHVDETGGLHVAMETPGLRVLDES